MSTDAITRKWMRSLVFVIAANAPLLAACAQGGGACYTAVPLRDQAGNEIPIEPVCRVLEQNLNQFCDEPPLACGLKIAPQFSDQLALSTWTPVDTQDPLKLVESIVRAQWETFGGSASADRIWEDRRPAMTDAAQQGRLTVSSAAIDLYQIGRPVDTYRIDPGNCGTREERRFWDQRVTGAGVRVVPTPEALGQLLATFKQLSPEEPSGDVLLFGGAAYTYYMFGNREPASIDNRMLVNQGINYVEVGGPTLFFRNVCEIKYRSTGAIR